MQHDAGTAPRTAIKAFDYEQFLAGLDQFRVPAHPLPGQGVRVTSLVMV
jgi:hypothetical protein